MQVKQFPLVRGLQTIQFLFSLQRSCVHVDPNCCGFVRSSHHYGGYRYVQVAARGGGGGGGGRRQQNPQNPRQISIDGTVQKIASGVIYASDDKDQSTWAITAMPTTKVLVTGTATLDFLRKGLLVQISAKPDEKGLIKDKVSDLTIVTLGTVGQSAAPDMGTAPKGKPGKKPAKPAPTTDSASGGTVGSIVAVHGQKISVKIDKKLSEIELTDDAKVNISVDIVAWAAKGDKIQVKGVPNPRKPGLCIAENVLITLSEPLTSGKKKR